MTASSAQNAQPAPDPEGVYTQARESLVHAEAGLRVAAAVRREKADHAEILRAELAREREEGKQNHPASVRRLQRLELEARDADAAWRESQAIVETARRDVALAREARALPDVTVEQVAEHRQRIAGTRREMQDVQAAIGKLTEVVSQGAGPRAAEVERLRCELEDARAEFAVSNALKDSARVDRAAAALLEAERAAASEGVEAQEARQAVAGLERRAAGLKVLLHDLERGLPHLVVAYLRKLAGEVQARHDALAAEVRGLAAELEAYRVLAAKVAGGPVAQLTPKLAPTVPTPEDIAAAVRGLRERLAKAGIESS